MEMDAACRELCKAPRGMLRVVHIEPRDPDCPVPQGDFETTQDVLAFLKGKVGAEQDVLFVFNDHGEPFKL